MWAPLPRTAVHEQPRPPAHFESDGKARPRLGDFLDRIAAIKQVAARELRTMRAGVEQRRRGRAGALVLVDAVEFLRAGFALVLMQGKAHCHAHPKNLGRLHPAATFRAVGILHVNQVAVVKILDADEVELQIGVGINRVGEFVQPELREARIEALDLDAERDVLQERLAMRFLELIDAVVKFSRAASPRRYR